MGEKRKSAASSAAESELSLGERKTTKTVKAKGKENSSAGKRLKVGEKRKSSASSQDADNAGTERINNPGNVAKSIKGRGRKSRV